MREGRPEGRPSLNRNALLAAHLRLDGWFNSDVTAGCKTPATKIRRYMQDVLAGAGEKRYPPTARYWRDTFVSTRRTSSQCATRLSTTLE